MLVIMQFRGAFYPTSLFLIFFLVKIQETVGEGNNTDQLQSSKAYVLKDISIGHSISCNSTNASSCSESRNERTFCPKGMFSPWKKVCLSCTDKCPRLMYISTPCSAEMDTQCSYCPLQLEPRLWDINMNSTCSTAKDSYFEPLRFAKYLLLFMSIIVIIIILVNGWFFYPFLSCKFESPMYRNTIDMLLCYCKKSIETRIKYTPVASSDNEKSFDDYLQTELNIIPTEVKITIMEPPKSTNDICDGSAQTVHADVEMNLCNKQPIVNDVNNFSRRELEVSCHQICKNASASSQDLSQMSNTCHQPPSTMDGSEECFVESHSDTSSANSIMATEIFNLKCSPPSPDRNGKSFDSSCQVMRQSSVVVMTEQPDPPVYVWSQSSDIPHLTDHNDICMNLPREIFHVKASSQGSLHYTHSNGNLDNIPRTPILDRRLDISYCSSPSLTSEGSSIVGDVRDEKKMHVV